MIDDLISIVVPVYNVSLYIDKCISSIIAQSYQNIEIILVDDGSSDGSEIICDRYAKLDKRVIVIHQKNSGVSISRNKGIALSSGKFLMFVDSDDYINPKTCELLLETIKKDNSDIVFSKYLKTSIFNECFFNYNLLSSTCLSMKESLNKIVDLNYPEGVNAVAKLYRSSIVKKHKFKPGYPLGEDQDFIFSILLDCNKISFVNAILYYYVYRDNSAGHNHVNINNEKKLFDIYKKIQLKMENNHCSSLNFEVFRIVQSNLTSLNKMIKASDYDYNFIKILRSDIKFNTFTILFSNFKNSKKLQLLLAGWLFPIYKKLYKVFMI